MPYNDKDLKKTLPKSSPLEKDIKGSLEYLSSMTDGDNDKPKKPSKFNKKAFKHAIGMVESNGGENMWNTTSSATGKYQFLYKLIKSDPSMDGISRKEFMNRPELQESVMEKALNGNLAGFTYGEKYANKIKKEYGSDYDVNSLMALVHFVGPGGARKFLKDPEGYRVPGTVNLTGDQYLGKFMKHFKQYSTDNPTEEAPKEPKKLKILSGEVPSTSPKEMEAQNVIQPKDNIQQRAPMMRDLLNKIPDDIGNYEARDKELNNFRDGGEVTGQSGVDQLVTLFEGGGSHEENPLGGIPQGIGANGKPNLVEEGETKWNDYIFSNAYDMDGNHTGENGKKSNVFERGGDLGCGGPGQPPCDENYYETIRNSRGGNTRKNEDGSMSSHLMADNNKDKAFPTLFRNEDGTWDDYSKDHDRALKRATKDKELYSFSNKEDLYKFAREGSWKENKFADGGALGPNDPPKKKLVTDPLGAFNIPGIAKQPKQDTKQDLMMEDNTISPAIEKELQQGQQYVKVEDQRNKYMGYDSLALQNPTETGVDFQKLVLGDTDEMVGSQAFLDRYNDPITRKRMKEQTGMTDEDIDNTIIRGLKSEKHVVDKMDTPWANAETWVNKANGKDQMFFKRNREEHSEGTDVHERLHSSKMDDKMGLVLQEILGSAHEQDRVNNPDGGYTPYDTRNYLDRPGETYGNFAGFREELGLKPGEQIDAKRMRKIIKDKKMESNFSNVYDDDKIVKALNTIAYQESSNNQEYKIS